MNINIKIVLKIMIYEFKGTKKLNVCATKPVKIIPIKEISNLSNLK